MNTINTSFYRVNYCCSNGGGFRYMEDLGNLHEFMINALIRKEEKNCCKYLIIRVERMRKSL